MAILGWVNVQTLLSVGSFLGAVVTLGICAFERRIRANEYRQMTKASLSLARQLAAYEDAHIAFQFACYKHESHPDESHPLAATGAGAEYLVPTPFPSHPYIPIWRDTLGAFHSLEASALVPDPFGNGEMVTVGQLVSAFTAYDAIAGER